LPIKIGTSCKKWFPKFLGKGLAPSGKNHLLKKTFYALEICVLSEIQVHTTSTCNSREAILKNLIDIEYVH
ncbi:MAG: hypothetical protein WCP85_22155, partial [Mariniphaga sp.]